MADFTPKVFGEYGTVTADDLNAMGEEIEEQEQQLTAHDTQLADHGTRITGTETGLTQANTDIDTLETDKYAKPPDGIPKTDMEAAVQTSLGKADTATQPHPTVIQEFISTIGNPVNLTGQPVPAGAIGVRLTMIPPGSGGGSGRRGAPGTVRCGGGGAAPNRPLFDFFVPLYGATTFDLTMDEPGLGGAAVTTDNTNGNDGVEPSECRIKIGGLTIRTMVPTGITSTFGRGGTNTSGLGGSAFSADMPAGANASASGGAGVNAANSLGMFSSSAGAGGGITATNVANNGSNGGFIRFLTNSGPANGGVVDGALPTAGDAAVVGFPGQGTGGGAASITQAAQAGADGVGYGAPGGGGGASTNGFDSGRGGNGGPGFARLEWVYA